MKYGAIFDLDGTLWNTTDTIIPAWNKVLRSHSEINKVITAEEMATYMGKNIGEIAHLMLPDHDCEKTIEIIKECCLAEQDELKVKGAYIYPNPFETLRELGRKFKLYIVSNCQDGYLQTFLNYYGVNDLFDDYEMSGRTGLAKGENIKLIIERNDLDAAVYVGDTQSDCDAANMAEIPFIYASYGFGKVDGAKYSIAEFSDLLRVLNTDTKCKLLFA